MPVELEKLRAELPEILLYSLPAFLLTVLIFRGRIPFLRFHRRPGAREPILWRGSEVFLAFLVWFLVQLTTAMLFSPGVTADLLGKPEATALSAALQTIVTGGFALHFTRRVAGQPLSTIGLTGASWANVPPVLALGILILFLLAAIHSLWALALHDAFGYEIQMQYLVNQFRDHVREGDISAMVSYIVAGVVFAPLVEESLFRGLLFGWLRERWGMVAGAVLSSLVFALVHFTLGAFLPLLALGILLAYVYERSGSLYPAILFHAIFNGTTFAQILGGGGG